MCDRIAPVRIIAGHLSDLATFFESLNGTIPSPQKGNSRLPVGAVAVASSNGQGPDAASHTEYIHLMKRHKILSPIEESPHDT